jgi:hypothetical protein
MNRRKFVRFTLSLFSKAVRRDVADNRKVFSSIDAGLRTFTECSTASDAWPYLVGRRCEACAAE